MKGVVFTEFIEMVEDTCSPELADDVLDSVDLAAGGAYTTVGTYDYQELVQLVVELARRTESEVPAIVFAFGKYLAGQFSRKFPQFFDVADAFTFLEKVDNYIHVEVRKLYPDAELPSFETNRIADGELEMIYQSERPFADLAQGLIEGAIEQFGEDASVERVTIESDVRFLIKQRVPVAS